MRGERERQRLDQRGKIQSNPEEEQYPHHHHGNLEEEREIKGLDVGWVKDVEQISKAADTNSARLDPERATTYRNNRLFSEAYMFDPLDSELLHVLLGSLIFNNALYSINGISCFVCK